MLIYVKEGHFKCPLLGSLYFLLISIDVAIYWLAIILPSLRINMVNCQSTDNKQTPQCVQSVYGSSSLHCCIPAYFLQILPSPALPRVSISIRKNPQANSLTETGKTPHCHLRALIPRFMAHSQRRSVSTDHRRSDRIAKSLPTICIPENSYRRVEHGHLHCDGQPHPVHLVASPK